MVENGVQGHFFCWIKRSEDQVRLTGLRWTCTPGAGPMFSSMLTCLLSCPKFPNGEREGRIPGNLTLGLRRN